MPITYGVNTDKPVSAKMVRDAIVTCFAKAHCSQTEIEGDIETLGSYCKEIVKKAFSETKGDFDNPTKNSLFAVIKWLSKFSESFRDAQLIKQHYFEIVELIKLIKDN